MNTYLNFPCMLDLNLDKVVFSTLMTIYGILHFVRLAKWFVQEAITVVGFGDLEGCITHVSPMVTRPFTGIAGCSHQNVYLNEFFLASTHNNIIKLIAVLVLVDLL